MSWINPKEQMPEHREVVIVLYLGYWSGRGSSGITDILEGATVAAWMPVPDKGELPE
jgi:hypothetical protein